jgi:ABC-type Zn2+ transport system substrate-binding protein/surface adhesin
LCCADAAIAGARLAATASAAMVISVKPIHFMIEGLLQDRDG